MAYTRDTLRRPPIAQDTRWRFFAAFCGTLLLSFLLFGLAYLALPHLREVMVQEDGFIENFTLFFFLEAVVVSALLLAQGVAKRSSLLVGGLSVFFVLEEISYGQRLFSGLTFPKLANGATFDGLGDLNRVMTIALDRIGVPWELVVGGVALLVALVFGRRLWGLLEQVWQPNSVYPYLLAAALCLAGAVVVDTYINPPTKFVLLEEVCELNASLSMLFAALSIWFVGRKV